MYKLIAAAALMAMIAPLPSMADPPKTLTVVKTIHLNAPVEKVWATVKDFDSLDKWHPALAKDIIVKGSNNEPGAVRALTIKDGPTIKEELISFDESRHSFQYKIIDSPFPITDYRSTLSVKPGKNGGSIVRWAGKFKRKNPADNPPEAENDAAGIKLIQGIYDGGLANLKKLLDS